MRIGIIAAMTEEIQPLLDQIKVDEEKFFDKTIYRAVVNNHEIFIFACGVGKVTSAVNSTLLADRHEIDLVINIGSAGGLHDDLTIGDLIIAEHVVYYDVDLTPFGYPLGQPSKMPHGFDTDKQIVSFIKKGIGLHDEKVKFGQIVSGDTFVNDEILKEKIKTNFPKALAIDMETASIGQIAFMLKKSFLAIRGISDAACSKSKDHHEEHLKTASENAAEYCLQLIRQYGG